MGWEERNGGSYYYRKEREGESVRSVYVGSGLVASLASQTDQRERSIRNRERKELQTERAAWARDEAQLDEIERGVNSLADSILTAAGFHRHKRQWRKKRHEQK